MQDQEKEEKGIRCDRCRLYKEDTRYQLGLMIFLCKSCKASMQSDQDAKQ